MRQKKQNVQIYFMINVNLLSSQVDFQEDEQR